MHRVAKKKVKLKALSLFANAGIGETYLVELGIKTVVANELLQNRVDLYSHLHPKTKMICGDITDPSVFNEVVSQSICKKVNLIIATPPCQGMSRAGKMEADDPRNTLIVKAMEAFTAIQPDFMMIENVPEMLKTSILLNGELVLIRDYLTDVIGSGYTIQFGVFDAADYGTPQRRKRAIVRIAKVGMEWSDPAPQERISLLEAIGDLPSLEAGEASEFMWHYSRPQNPMHTTCMRHTATGCTAFDNDHPYLPLKDGRVVKAFKTSYKRMHWDRPASTVTMKSRTISSQSTVHPGRELGNGQWSDARVLTPLELFRITGLPDDWDIPDDTKEYFLREVIGEAVPPKMMRALFAPVIF